MYLGETTQIKKEQIIKDRDLLMVNDFYKKEEDYNIFLMYLILRDILPENKDVIMYIIQYIKYLLYGGDIVYTMKLKLRFESKIILLDCLSTTRVVTIAKYFIQKENSSGDIVCSVICGDEKCSYNKKSFIIFESFITIRNRSVNELIEENNIFKKKCSVRIGTISCLKNENTIIDISFHVFELRGTTFVAVYN